MLKDITELLALEIARRKLALRALDDEDLHFLVDCGAGSLSAGRAAVFALACLADDELQRRSKLQSG